MKRRQFMEVLGASAIAGGMPQLAHAAKHHKGGGHEAMMKVANDILVAGVASNAAPGFVAMTGNSGGVTWVGIAGEKAPGVPMTEDTVFRIFSMTKAVGSTAAMILVERGKLNLNAPVDTVLPDFAKIQVLDGFDGDTPRYRPPKSRATFRQLATHTSGLVYEFWNPMIAKWMAVTKSPSIISGKKEALFYPMAWDPGTRWDYGIGIDWLCQAVEKIDGRRIDKFCQEEIFDPLGMSSTAFEAEGALAARMGSVVARGADGKFVPFPLACLRIPSFTAWATRCIRARGITCAFCACS